MKSVSIEEVEQVQEDTFNEFMKLFPVLLHLPKADDVVAVRSYFAARKDIEIHMVRIISHYRIFLDRLNKSNDFQVFSEELFLRQLESYKEQLAEKNKPIFTVVDNGDFNEVK